MKAFLLAAGNGTRLRPLTDTTPKCLLPIQGVPLLQLWLQNCAKAGIDEVLINAHAHVEKVRAFVRTQKPGIKVCLVEEPVLLGSAGTLAEYSAFVKDEKTFFVLYADVLTNFALSELFAFHQDKGRMASIGVHRVSDPAQCGVVDLESTGIVRSFAEKPLLPKSNLVFSGIMAANQRVLELAPQTRPADIGFHLLPGLQGEMAAFEITDFLMDIGTPENYAAAQLSWPGL